MRLRIRSSARRLLRPVLVSAALAMLAGEALTQALALDAPALAGKAAVAAAPPVWKTITLGTHKRPLAYRQAFEAAKIRIGDTADEILGRPAFAYGRTPMQLDLVVRSAAELGFAAERVPLGEIYRRAGELGLALCPPEIGPKLRLDYRDQPPREILHIAMRPVATYDRAPTILALANFGSGLLLIGSDGRPDFMTPREWRFVFAVPPLQQGLEALAPPN